MRRWLVPRESDRDLPPGRTAIITMVMRRDFPHAAVSLSTLDSQLGPSVRHFVLLNDAPDPVLERQLSMHPHRYVLTTEKNLGVPHGRNLLLNKALEWGADRVVVFDDDLIAPDDYIHRLTSVHHRLLSEGHPVGAVAPALLNYGFVHENLLTRRTRASFDRQSPASPGGTERWHQRLQQVTEPVPAGAIEHLGIRDWERHYLEVGSRAFDRWWVGLGEDSVIAPHRPTVLANVAKARLTLTQVRPESLVVDTVPGGVWCVGRTALESIGLLDTAFSPFGFEDADWCIRAIRAGFVNYCLPDVLVAHDYQSRLSLRPGAEIFTTRGRARALLLRKHATTDRIVSQGFQTLAELLDTHVLAEEERGAAISAFMQGLIEGLRRTPDPLADPYGTPPVPDKIDFRIQNLDLGMMRSDLDPPTAQVRWDHQPGIRTTGDFSMRWPDGTLLECELAVLGFGTANEDWQFVFSVAGGDSIKRVLSLLDIDKDGIDTMLANSSTAEAPQALKDVFHLIGHIRGTDCRGRLRIEIRPGLQGNKSQSLAIHHECPTTE